MPDTGADAGADDATGGTVAGGAGAGGDPIPELERQVGLLLRRARSFSASVAAAVHPDLDPPAYGLLLRLVTAGPERTTDLAAFLGVGKPTVSRQLSQLVDLGLVERSEDPSDGRASLVRVTDVGLERFSAARQARRERFRELLGEWSTSDLDQLGHLLARFNAI